ncbi:MAG: cysteinyl-tRNA synthetase [bacterium]|jgi:cysteinyl-tRNA synthetase
MKLSIYNSLTNRKEEFIPLEKGKVKMYACGITVYDRCHLGHARGAVNFDAFRSLLEELNYEVTYVRNYTDIDDKIIKRANEEGIAFQHLVERMIHFHDEDMAILGISPPTIAPRATEHIDEIIAMVQELIKKGHAYAVKGDVFFKVRSFKEYGKLSKKNINDLAAGIRVEVNQSKKDVLDFALWKSSKPDEPYWESPWGKGRPGWHIECSAMSQKYLGDTFDIHAGGSDLIFPHHENEIAQSECSSSKQFARYWMHNGMIKIGGLKMSKSLGNFATIEDLAKKYHPELLRFFLLSTQYRTSLNFNEDAIKQSLEGLDRIYGALQKYEHDVNEEPASNAYLPEVKEYKSRFFEVMCDDINTPAAIGVLFQITKQLNISLNSYEISAQYYKVLKELGTILGLFTISPDLWFKTLRIQSGLENQLSDDAIDQLLIQRVKARESKDWATADQIRDTLKENSIVVEDRDGKTHWHRKA